MLLYVSYQNVKVLTSQDSLVHDWVIKVLGMSSRACATGHIKDPMPLIEKSRASCHYIAFKTWQSELFQL